MEITIKELKNYKPRKKTLIFIQPYLFEYRNQVMEKLQKDINILGIFKKKVKETDLNYLDANPKNGISYLKKTIYLIFYRKNFDELIIFAPPMSKNIGIIVSLLLLKIIGCKVIIHGQGMYKNINTNFGKYMIHLFWIILSNKYLLYTSKGKVGPFKNNFFKKKIFVINNRFENFKEYSIPKNKLTFISHSKNASPLRILFIGRDRLGANINFLIENFVKISNKYNLELHIIGPLKKLTKIPNIIEHGPLFSKDIIDIAKNCSIGIYPGDAGLSILHYMCLGLCPVLHSSYKEHSGPEPYYVTHEKNGMLFKKDSGLSLRKTIIFLYKNQYKLNSLRINAYNDAKEIHSIDYSLELKDLILK